MPQPYHVPLIVATSPPIPAPAVMPYVPMPMPPAPVPAPAMPMMRAASAVAPPPQIEWLSGADFTGPAPMREWLVAGMIPMNTVTLMGGDGGTGKSLLALQLSCAVATGGIWLNRVPMPGGALYFSCEDDRDELHRRLAAIAAQTGQPACPSGLAIANMAGKDAVLTGMGKRDGILRPTATFDALEARVAAARPRLVVLDTLADLFPANENDRGQVRQFVGLLRGLAIRNRCAVLLLAHPSKAGLVDGSGLSGSTAWNNSVRSRLYFERIRSDGYESDPDARRLVVLKSNYGATGDEIAVRWREGVFVAEAGAVSGEADLRAERVFLNCLSAATAQGRYWSTLHAPKNFAEMPSAEGLRKDVLKRAMERLFADGKIMVRQIRENSKDRTVILVAPQTSSNPPKIP